MIKEVTMYAASCDGCGYIWKDENITAYPDKDTVEDLLNDSGWHLSDHSKVYCPDCWTIGDNDEVIIKTNP